MSYFIFNGYHSYHDLGLICSVIPFPSQAYSEYSYTNLPSMTQPIRTKNTYFSSKAIDIVCINKDKSNTDYIYSVMRGQGKLILSNCTDRYFDVTVNELIPQFASVNIDKIPISFTAMPFAYSLENTPIEVTSDTTTIEVGGNFYAEPTIQIYGNGNGTITINDTTLSIYVDNYMTIDVSKRLALKDNTVILTQTIGNLPDLILNVGNNSVSFSGEITSMEIIKNERWL